MADGASLNRFTLNPNILADKPVILDVVDSLLANDAAELPDRIVVVIWMQAPFAASRSQP